MTQIKSSQAEICVNRAHEVFGKRQGPLKHCSNTKKYWLHAYEILNRVFPGRFTNGGIFNNMLLFENNKLLFSLLFSDNFHKGDKALMEGDKVVMGGSPSPPHWGKACLRRMSLGVLV